MKTRFSKLLAYVELSRPINGVIAFISVFLGALLASGGVQPILGVGAIALAALLLLSAGNAFNDYCDVEIDRINKPNRPIVSGRIERTQARSFAFVLMVLGVWLGMLVNWTATLLSLVVAVLLLLYAVKLKQTLLLGNLVVATLTALVFLAGAVAAREFGGIRVPILFAFLFTAAREIVKDIEDVEGDQRVGARTLPIVWGTRKATWIAVGIMGIVILFSPVPYLLKWYGISYLVVVFFGVDLVLAYLMWRLLRDDSAKTAAMVQKWMKADIFLGLLAIYLG